MSKKFEKKLLIACVVLLVACLITAGYFFQQALNAKYATAANGSANTGIAKFSVAIDDTSEGLGWENGGTFDPFVKDTLTYTCEVDNSSEVAIKATPSIDASSLGDALEVDTEHIVSVNLEPGETGNCQIPVKLKANYSSVDPTNISGIKVNVNAVQVQQVGHFQ